MGCSCRMHADNSIVVSCYVLKTYTDLYCTLPYDITHQYAILHDTVAVCTVLPDFMSTSPYTQLIESSSNNDRGLLAGDKGGTRADKNEGELAGHDSVHHETVALKPIPQLLH
jgi:hypothetical protein